MFSMLNTCNRELTDFHFEPVSTYLRGGFDWHLNFFWEWLPPKDRAMRLRDPTSTFKTPAIAGGLFAIDRKLFSELGFYDMGMKFLIIKMKKDYISNNFIHRSIQNQIHNK